jgi:hypothetical protein
MFKSITAQSPFLGLVVLRMPRKSGRCRRVPVGDIPTSRNTFRLEVTTTPRLYCRQLWTNEIWAVLVTGSVPEPRKGGSVVTADYDNYVYTLRWQRLRNGYPLPAPARRQFPETDGPCQFGYCNVGLAHRREY